MANGHRMACVACGFALLGAGIRAETPDAWLEYVEAQGRSAVDVGVVGRTNTKVQVSFQWTAKRHGEVCLLGARKTGDDASRAEFIYSNSDDGNVVFGLGSQQVQLRGGKNYRWERDRDFTATIEFTPRNETQTNETPTNETPMNETQTAMTFALAHWAGGLSYYPGCTNDPQYVVADGVSDTGLNLYLFADNIDGVVTNRAWARVYSLKVWQDGELVRDLKPCLKGGRAGLHDAVSGDILYALDGTEELIYDATYNEPDEFVEYVDSTGGAYVDVEVHGRSGTSCCADMAWLDLNGDYAFLDARSTGDSRDRVYLLHTAWDGGLAIGYADFIRANDYPNNAKFHFIAGQRYLVKTTLAAGNQTVDVGTVDVDKERIYTGTAPGSYDTGRTFYLFANHVGDGVENCSKVRLYALKIWQDGNLVRDFTPCIKYGRFALYDAVDKRIFYPKGGRLVGAPLTVSGKPDYELEYIESPGGTYLDTGVRARTGTAATAKMRWNAFGVHETFSDVDAWNENTFLGACAELGDKRMYLIHSPNGKVWFGYGDTRIYPKVTTEQEVTTKQVDLAVGVDCEWAASYKVDAQTLAVNGIQYLSEQIPGEVDAECNLYLFGANVGNRYLRYAGRFRVYELKIWQDGKLVRDFRPCMKNGRAGLYDAVGDKVYYTIRALPDSCIGPAKDVSALRPTHLVEYLETDGAHWMNMEVVGRSGTVAEFDMAWLDVGGDFGFFGSSRKPCAKGEDDPFRFYPWHNAQKSFGYGCKNFTYVKKNDPSATIGWDAAVRGEGVFIDPGRTYHVRTDFAANRIQIIVNDETVLDRSGDFDVDTGLPMYLFGENVKGQAGNMSRARIYGMKVWQDGVLVRNFVPMRLGGENGMPALWDKVSAKPFFLNEKEPFARVGPVMGKNPSGFLILFR